MANKAIAFLVLLLISSAAHAATYAVGGNNGWDTGVNFVTWAGRQTFVVGDTLVFNFDPTHAVDEVNQADYQSCNEANPISTSASSPTTIELDAPGIRYFICPRSNHCVRGQKLAVIVTGNSSTPETPPAVTSTPPRPTGGATSILSGSTGPVVGLSVVLGAVVWIMG